MVSGLAYLLLQTQQVKKTLKSFLPQMRLLTWTDFKIWAVVKNGLADDSDKLDYFLSTISGMRKRGNWTKEEIVSLFHEMIPDFGHEEKGKYLDSKM